MKLGLQIPSFTWPGGARELASRLGEIARTAEDAGFSSLWVMDHFFQIDMMGRPEEPMLEGYSALAYLAARTQRVTLGTLVTGVTYRHPGVLIKTVSTLDVLSGGRAWLGIGAAWYDREHAGLGVPFPPLAERFERLEETLRIAKAMWSPGEPAGRFAGEHYRLEELLDRPRPIRTPHPPIMIGGLGERKTLRLVAQYADAWNAFDYVGPAELLRKKRVLEAHCESLGRDPAEIECTTLGTVDLQDDGDDPREVIAKLRAQHDAGFSHAIVNMPGVHELRPIERLGREILPELP